MARHVVIAPFLAIFFAKKYAGNYMGEQMYILDVTYCRREERVKKTHFHRMDFLLGNKNRFRREMRKRKEVIYVAFCITMYVRKVIWARARIENQREKVKPFFITTSSSEVIWTMKKGANLIFLFLGNLNGLYLQSTIKRDREGSYTKKIE